MRILLIEDDKKLSFAITEQLQKEGNITDCCYDGETALPSSSSTSREQSRQ